MNRQPEFVTYTDSNGVQQSLTLNFRTYQTKTQCSNGPCYISNVDNIVYPDGSVLSFQYETDPSAPELITGRLSEIVLPAGGVISYTYTTLNGSSDAIGSLTRTTSDGEALYTLAVTSQSTTNTISNTTVSYPDGHSESVHFSGYNTRSSLNLGGRWQYFETAHTVYTSSVGSTVVSSSMRCYNGSSGDCSTWMASLPITQISDTNTPAPNLSFKTVTYLNTAGLETEKDEYDFTSSTPTRVTTIAYAAMGNNILNRPQTVTTRDGSGNLIAQTTYAYDEYSLAPSGVSGLVPITGSRGNQTTESRLVAGSATITTHGRFDDAGQVTSSTDGNDNTFTYGHDGTDTYVTQKTYPPVAAGTFSETYTPDPNTGMLMQSTDMNGQPTAYTYDSMLRNTGICYPGGGYTQTSYSATTKIVSRLSGTGTGCTPGGGVPSGSWLTTTIQYDGYGRVISSTDPAGNTTGTRYDSMGRVYSLSNPHGSGSSSTDGITYYMYDALGEKVKQTDQDGSVQWWCFNGVATNGQPNCPSLLGSSTGSWVVYQDEAGNRWQRTYDALGRLTRVLEPNGSSPVPSLETDYGYDPMNNLVSVSQQGSPYNCRATLHGVICNYYPEQRLFTYDSLSRLVQAFNPESGWVCYGTTSGGPPNGSNCTSGYDANGNLLAKTDARGITVNYTYDALNRLLTALAPGINYHYAYDAVSGVITYNSHGRLVYASNYVNADEVFSYDRMGRLNWQSPWTPAHTNHNDIIIRATYDLAGNMTSLTYPDGRVVNQTWDTAGHLQAVTFDNWNGTSVGYSYLSSALYWPDGSRMSAAFGDGTIENIAKNMRFQPTAITVNSPQAGQLLLSKTFCYVSGCGSAASNNGNIWQIADGLNGGQTQSFAYDTLNRLISFSTVDGSMQQSYAYDAFGNLSQSGTLSSQVTYGSNNQINSGGVGYDAAGNMTSFYNGSWTTSYTFDSLDQLTQVNGAGTGAYTYVPTGHRARKDANGTWTEYIYFNGLPIAELNADGSWSDYIFANGQRIARADSTGGAENPNNTTTYYHGDQVGSARLLTAGGQPVWSDTYYPFGQEASSVSGTNHYRYTGKERDSESGNDYFGARYYASTMGRFLSPDPLMASAKAWDPQTWNRYVYGRNNPPKMIDPTGMAEVTAAQCTKDKACVTVNVNVIYDKNANGGSGLTDKQKAAFEKNQLQNAKDQYGNADVHLNVSYTAGEINSKGNLTGVEKGALNVFVTDSGGAASFDRGGYAVSRINVNSTNNEDLPHEMAHHFMGDMSSVLGRTLAKDPSGISVLIDNLFTDMSNDGGRIIMNNITPHLPNYPSGAPMTIFNPQARDFQQRITPQTKPQ